ncbi:MAG: hypothetical protein ACE5KF_04260 [Kiloniellaceae bacterium]
MGQFAVGQGLLENTPYDLHGGPLSTGPLVAYRVSGADPAPIVELIGVGDFPSATDPMGVEGAGEAGAVGPSPAVVDAIVDALSPRGLRHIDMPATPERVWRAIRDAGKGQGPA